MNSPFEGITDLQKNKLFKILESHIYDYNKYQEILSTIKNENNVCIILKGSANIVSINYNGEEYLIEKLKQNSVFGSGISTINSNDYQIISQEDLTVLVIDYKKLMSLRNIGFSYFNKFLLNLFDIISTKLKENNERMKILTQKTIRDKLLTYFDNEYKINHSKFIYVKNSLKDLSDYLSVNRSAMFRELRLLKDEKFIKIDGKRITLLYVPSI